MFCVKKWEVSIKNVSCISTDNTVWRNKFLCTYLSILADILSKMNELSMSFPGDNLKHLLSMIKFKLSNEFQISENWCALDQR